MQLTIRKKSISLKYLLEHNFCLYNCNFVIFFILSGNYNLFRNFIYIKNIY